MLSNLPKVTQLVSGEAGVWSKVYAFNHYTKISLRFLYQVILVQYFLLTDKEYISYKIFLKNQTAIMVLC